MRAVYRLLGLVRRYGPGPVETACARALELDVIAVAKIASMLQRATETQQPSLPAAAVGGGRFARDPAEFATGGTTTATGGTTPATTAATGGTSGERPGGAVLTLIRGGQAVATFESHDITEENEESSTTPAPPATRPAAPTTSTTKETH